MMTPTLGYAFAAALTLFLLAWGFRTGVRRSLAPARVPHVQTPADLGLAFADCRIPTANGKQLAGWLIPSADLTGDASPAVLILHGWGGNAAGMLPLAPALHSAGFTVLMIDARCHGCSDEDDFTSLPRFAEDADHALRWLAQQPAVDASRIALIGHSVGAGAALLAASRQAEVAAVVSLAAFSHPETVMRGFLAHKRVPFVPFGWLVLRYVEHVIGHRFDDIAPVNTITRVGCPVLLIHGQDDVTVPASEAERIHAARSGDHVSLRIIVGSHDDFGSPDDTAEALATLVSFLRLALSGARVSTSCCTHTRNKVCT